ncbi:RNA-binding protein 33-like [Littorina saxatilis]|uniref:RNA-binding protein 33-like n=1 Tax=Littorina saxatilis TaxID=31220 RepID=UPI0038B5D464
MEFTIGQTQSWREGRRIVSLQELAKQMRCKHCKALLDLNQIIKETRFGLASILYIMCQCGLLNDVHTGKRQEGDGSRHLFEVNIKASINLLLYGIGAQNIIHFLQTGLDIPLPPPEDNSLILPMHSTPDMSTSLPVTMATYNPPITTPLSPQLQVGQHPPLNPQLQHQHHHHHQQQQHHHEQQQHQVVNVPQVKDMFRVAHAGHSKGGGSQSAGHKGGGSQSAGHKGAGGRCLLTTLTPPPTLTPQPTLTRQRKLLRRSS